MKKVYEGDMSCLSFIASEPIVCTESAKNFIDYMVEVEGASLKDAIEECLKKVKTVIRTDEGGKEL